MSHCLTKTPGRKRRSAGDGYENIPPASVVSVLWDPAYRVTFHIILGELRYMYFVWDFFIIVFFFIIAEMRD